MTLKRQTQEMVEVQFPLYLKNGEKYTAFPNETTMVQVYVYESGNVLVTTQAAYSYDVENVLHWEQITEDDFQFALGMALERLSKFQTVNA